MAAGQRTGLDELMIVNPGSPGTARTVILRRRPTADQVSRASSDIQWESQGYERVGGDRRRARGRFFLGADGALYEVIE